MQRESLRVLGKKLSRPTSRLGKLNGSLAESSSALSVKTKSRYRRLQHFHSEKGVGTDGNKPRKGKVEGDDSVEGQSNEAGKE